jgi:hypothetical protein
MYGSKHKEWYAFLHFPLVRSNKVVVGVRTVPYHIQQDLIHEFVKSPLAAYCSDFNRGKYVLTLPDDLVDILTAKQIGSAEQSKSRDEAKRREICRIQYVSEAETNFYSARRILTSVHECTSKDELLQRAEAAWDAYLTRERMLKEAAVRWPESLDRMCPGDSELGELALIDLNSTEDEG